MAQTINSIPSELKLNHEGLAISWDVSLNFLFLEGNIRLCLYLIKKKIWLHSIVLYWLFSKSIIYTPIPILFKTILRNNSQLHPLSIFLLINVSLRSNKCELNLFHFSTGIINQLLLLLPTKWEYNPLAVCPWFATQARPCQPAITTLLSTKKCAFTFLAN